MTSLSAYSIHNPNKAGLNNFTVDTVPLDGTNDPPCPPGKYYDWMIYECVSCGTCCGGNTPEPSCLNQGIDPAKACPYDDRCEPVEESTISGPTWISQYYWIVILVTLFLVVIVVLVVCVLKKASISAWYAQRSMWHARQNAHRLQEEGTANEASREQLLVVRENLEHQERERQIEREEERQLREQARDVLNEKYKKAKERIDDLIKRGYSVPFSSLGKEVRSMGIAPRIEIRSMPWKGFFESLGLDPYAFESLEGKGPFEIGMDKLLSEKPELKVTDVLSSMLDTVKPGTSGATQEPVEGCIDALEYAIDELPPSVDKMPNEKNEKTLQQNPPTK